MSDRISSTNDEESFSFGLAELRRAAAERTSASADPAAARQAREPRPRTVLRPLAMAKAPVSGFDPYNSAGGHDRQNAWNGVRKR